MTVESITSATTPVVGAPGRDYTETSKLDFVNLLVAQIQNQDPLSPMDNAEFTSQITQFTILEELENLGAKLDDNLVIGQSINNTALLALVGREVTVRGDTVRVETSGVSASYLEVAGAGRATIEVLDDHGNVVATYYEDVKAGRNDVTWDGYGNDEELAPPGKYHLRVSVENDGAPVNFLTLMTGPVEGLRYENNLAIVEVDGQDFYVSEIYKVS